MNDLFFDNRIAGLILKFLQEDISEAEYQELQAWAGTSDRAREIFDELTSEEKLPEELANYSSVRKRVLTKIHAAEPETRVVVQMDRGFRWKPWLAAAVVVGLALAGYFYLKVPAEKDIAKVETDDNRYKNDIPPGSEKAVLKLGDGSIIQLDSAAKGIVAQQGNISIINGGGALKYAVASGNSHEVYSNTIETQKGGRYRLTLSDGTQVWLNALSSVKYPTRFIGNYREVVITGEVFFDVAKNQNMPFIVKYNGMSIEVTGTEFNVSAYINEKSVTATLIEGAVRVSNNKESVRLLPGEQAEMTKDNDLTINKTVNVDEVIAWKDGKFKFNNSDIKSIMRQLERWYDIEVFYEGNVTTSFNATNISMDLPISELLKLFELTEQIRFKIEGRKVIVMP